MQNRFFNLIVVWRWMEFEYLIVTIHYLLVVKVNWLNMKLQVGHSNHPPPEHVLVVLIQLRTKLVKDWTTTLAVESTCLIIVDKLLTHSFLFLFGVDQLFLSLTCFHFVCCSVHLTSLWPFRLCQVLIWSLNPIVQIVFIINNLSLYVFLWILKLLKFIFGLLHIRILTIIFVTQFIVWVVQILLINLMVVFCWTLIKTLTSIMDNTYFLFVIDVVVIYWSMVINNITSDILFLMEPVLGEI